MKILDFIQNNIRNEFLDVLMQIVTHIGDYGLIWLITAIVLIAIKKHRACGIIMAVSLLLCLLIGNIMLKPLIARPRPFSENSTITLLIAPPSDYSFPSGHTMSSFAATTVLFLSSLGRYIKIPALILSTTIAFSRLYLYVHYPSDVLAGALMGIICGVIAYLGLKTRFE
ncbi:MAG: phosphatase PAP2 family protein [Oscillospiraceae bacterium]|nr:phosphatase PAP2 family protein [Oscillospiraceae bacterium]